MFTQGINVLQKCCVLPPYNLTYVVKYWLKAYNDIKELIMDNIEILYTSAEISQARLYYTCYTMITPFNTKIKFNISKQNMKSNFNVGWVLITPSQSKFT